MRIGLDARLYLSERTGIGSYTAHLLQSFARIAGEDDSVLFTDRPVSLPGPRFSNEVIEIKKRILWTLLFLPARLRRVRVDLFHGTANFEVPPAAGCPLVSTVHDLIPLHFPDLVSRKFYLLFRSLIGRALRVSNRVITDSEYSRRDILDRFPLPPDKITVIPLAAHPRFRPEPDPEKRRSIRKKYRLDRNFILFVGVFEPRKNIPFLVDAFTIFQRDFPIGREFQLALAGGAGYRGEEISQEIGQRDLEPDVRLLGYVADEDLPALYGEATLLVVPSRYEGFGLPALEAMSCGTPVLAADSSSLPEVVADAGRLFPLGDPGLLAEEMARLTGSSSTLKEMSRKGMERASLFTWDETARRTLEVYRQVLAAPQGTR